jgi:hypothetical protein
MTRLVRTLLVVAGVLLLSGLPPASGQVAPCDATCVKTPDPGGTCTTHYDYACSSCIWVVPGCVRGECVQWFWEGLRVKHVVCTNGVQAWEWLYVPCGLCSP